MAMTPLQRKAAFRSAVTLKRMTMSAAADSLGVSYNHLMLVLAGERLGSAALKERIATLIDARVSDVFADEPAA
jgi:transcriptional regulator with XRE-family HTH domain